MLSLYSLVKLPCTTKLIVLLMLYMKEVLPQLYKKMLLIHRNHHLANCIGTMVALSSHSTEPSTELHTVFPQWHIQSLYTHQALNLYSISETCTQLSLKDIKVQGNGYGGGVIRLRRTNSRSITLPINTIHRSSTQTMQRIHLQAVKRGCDEISALAVSGRVNRIVLFYLETHSLSGHLLCTRQQYTIPLLTGRFRVSPFSASCPAPRGISCHSVSRLRPQVAADI